MFADHAAVTFPYHFSIELRAVGRMAYPIFIFLLAEGFRHTKAPHKFLMRLFVLALVSQIPYSLAITRASQSCTPWTQYISFISNTNIFYTLFLGGMAIMIYKWLGEKSQKPTAYIGAVFPMAVLAELLTADYGGMGVLFVFSMYVITEQKRRIIALSFFALSQFFPVVLLLTEVKALHLLMILFTIAAVGLLTLYNGKRGRNTKWLFYAAYPAHLAVLAIAAILSN